MLTAGHCGSQSHETSWGSYAGNFYAGVTNSWNFFPAGFDIRLLYGAVYGNQIWVGNSAGSGTLTGTGYVGVGSVSIGDYYLFSGGLSGQATLKINRLAGPLSCFEDELGKTCYLYLATATGNAYSCGPGDSGSPWGLYNASNGTLAALAVHTAGKEYGVYPRVCYGTSVQHLIVALGGGTVG